MTRPLIVLLLLFLIPLNVFATDTATGDQLIAARLQKDGLQYEAENAVLWVEQDILLPEQAQAALALLQKGIEGIELEFGLTLDTEHYAENRIHVFVVPAVRTSHVYGGYEHMRYDKPYLYLNPRRLVRGGAPYLHELTHLLAWRFGSHSLREGFAVLVELDVSSKGYGKSSGLFGMRDAAGAEQHAAAILQTGEGQKVLEWIGRNGQTDPAITSPDNGTREAFYVLSQSYVRYLFTRLGSEAFLAIYRADDPESELLLKSGKTREAWMREWLSSLAGPTKQQL